MGKKLKEFIPPLGRLGGADVLKVTDFSLVTTGKQVDFMIGWTSSSKAAFIGYKRLVYGLSDEKNDSATGKKNLVQCDGPCEKFVVISDINEFESCEHSICGDCMLQDETECPACMKLLSNYSMNLIRVHYFYPKGRQYFKYELDGALSIQWVLEMLSSRIDDMQQKTIYYTNQPRLHINQLQLLPAEHRQPIGNLSNPDGSETINLVIVAPGRKFKESDGE